MEDFSGRTVENTDEGAPHTQALKFHPVKAPASSQHPSIASAQAQAPAPQAPSESIDPGILTDHHVAQSETSFASVRQEGVDEDDLPVARQHDLPLSGCAAAFVANLIASLVESQNRSPPGRRRRQDDLLYPFSSKALSHNPARPNMGPLRPSLLCPELFKFALRRAGVVARQLIKIRVAKLATVVIKLTRRGNFLELVGVFGGPSVAREIGWGPLHHPRQHYPFASVTRSFAYPFASVTHSFVLSIRRRYQFASIIH